MYFRRSLNRIVKVRPLVNQTLKFGFGRYYHSCYLRPIFLLKNNEIRNVSRKISNENFKVNGNQNENPLQKSRSRTVGIDLMAPNFRSTHFLLKSTTKNGSETGGKFHTMPQKSQTLRMCRQASKNLSTSQGANGHPEEKIENKEEIIEAVKRDKADICHAICGPQSKVSISKSDTSATLSHEKPLERTIDKLTDAEIEDICKTRCPCRECNAHEKIDSPPENSQHSSAKLDSSTNAELVEKGKATTTIQQSTENLKTTQLPENSSTIIQSESTSTQNVQHSSTATQSVDPLAIKNMNEPKNQTGGHSFQMESLIQPKDSAITKNRQARQNRRRIFQTRGRIPQTMQNSNSQQQVTSQKQYQDIPSNNRPDFSATNYLRQPARIHPSNSQRIPSMPRDNFDQGPSTGAMRPSPLGTSNNLTSSNERIRRSRRSDQLSSRYHPTQRDIQQQISPTQMENNKNNCQSYTENFCHFEQLKPVPFRYRPIYDRNYHSDPVVQSFSPKYNSFDARVPYMSSNQSQLHKRQRHRLQKMPTVFGSKSTKNRQPLQSEIPKRNPNPIEFTDRIVNDSKITGDIGEGVALPMSENLRNENMDVNKVQDDAEQQSRKVMSKLVENLSVVIEGPEKLKLVTSSYPELRDEKDVIIQMEYVNLTDADRRHYLTGKFNPYSYATTVTGRTGSGIIIETGRNVQNVKHGDKVFVKPVSCGKCSLCLTDRRNVCENVTVSEMSSIGGVLSRLHVHSSESVVKIPDNVSLINGAMTWTLSTAIRACQKAGISAGDVIMVIGGGPLATATGLAAQLMGATTVCLADARKTFLEDAQKLGIETVFLIDPKSPSKNTAVKIWEQIGDYPRLTFDCRGSQLTNEIAVDATKTGGKVIVMTSSENDIPLPVSNVITRDIDIIISTIGNDESDIAALRFLSTNKVFFSNLMYKHYDLSNVDEAFRHLYGPGRLDSQIIVECGCKCGSKDSTEKKTEPEV